MSGTRDRPRRAVAPWVGIGTAGVLVVAAITTPAIFHWDVHAATFPPLLATLHPHVGPGTLPALTIGVLTVVLGRRASVRSPWGVLLGLSFLVAVAWIVSLAAVDGVHGIARGLDYPGEYLTPARQVTDVGAMLRGYIDRIPATAADRWPVSAAGHPPAALLFFVLLVRIGLGSGFAAGLVVVVLAATTPAAVLICVRRLGSEVTARRVAPFLAVGPSAVWIAVTGDALFGAVAAWGLCCLAVAATSRRRAARYGVGAAAGLLLGLAVFLSYGLVLLGVLALAVLLLAGSWRVLPVALGAAVVVALAFAAGGFAWWAAYPVLVERYWAGVAQHRPGLYWIWADLAVLVLSAGPAVAAAIAVALSRIREVGARSGDRAVLVLTLAALVVVVAADLSGLSKSEVERIWIPFVPWLLLGTALLTPRWRRAGLIGAVATGLAVEHLLHTAW